VIGSGDLQALDQVGVAGEVVTAVGRPVLPDRRLASDPQLVHHPPDPLLVDLPTFPPKHDRQPSISVGRPPGSQPSQRPP
jgi:hypothetical protein